MNENVIDSTMESAGSNNLYDGSSHHIEPIRIPHALRRLFKSPVDFFCCCADFLKKVAERLSSLCATFYKSREVFSKVFLWRLFI